MVAATLRECATGAILATAYCFPCGLPTARDEALGLVARSEPLADGYIVTLEVDRFAHAVAIEADGFVSDDNFLHIEPDAPRRVFLGAQSTWPAPPWHRLCPERSGARGDRPSRSRGRPLMLTDSMYGADTARPLFIAHNGHHLLVWHHPALATARRGAARGSLPAVWW